MPRAWLLALLVVAAALRLAALDRQSFWYDEAVSVALAGHPLGDLLSGRVRDLGNPPLYPALLRIWTLVFGTGDGPVRALSALLGIATVPLVYAVGRRSLGASAALAGTLLFALAPFHLQMAQEARTYTLLTFVGVASVYALQRALAEPGRWRWWITLGIAVGLMALSHYFGLFLAVAEAGYVLLANRRDRALLARATAAFALGAVVFSFWLPSLLGQLAVQGNLSRSADSWHRHLIATPLVFGVGSTLVWKDNASAWRVVVGVLAALAFSASVLLGLLRNQRRPGIGLLIAWLLVPVALPALLSLLASPLYNTRYVILASVPFYLLAGAGLASLPRPQRLAGLGALAVVMSISQAGYFTRPVKHQWREVAAHVEARLQPGDLLLFDSDYNEGAYAHYAPARPGGPPHLRLVDPPSGAPPQARLFGTTAIGAAAVDQTALVRRAPRVWLLLSDVKPASAQRDREFFAPAEGGQGDWTAADSVNFKGITVALFHNNRVRPD